MNACQSPKHPSRQDSDIELIWRGVLVEGDELRLLLWCPPLGVEAIPRSLEGTVDGAMGALVQSSHLVHTA